MDVTLREPSDTAVRWVADHLRHADRRELHAAHGLPTDDMQIRRRLLMAAALVSQAGDCWAAHADDTGEPVALCGIAPVDLISGTASPWLLGTDRAPQARRALVLLGCQAARQWSQRWALQENYVDTRNIAALRWLQRIGYTLDPPLPHGPLGLSFRRFWRAGARGGR